jgi:hypothetical protein
MFGYRTYVRMANTRVIREAGPSMRSAEPGDVLAGCHAEIAKGAGEAAPVHYTECRPRQSFSACELLCRSHLLAARPKLPEP